MFHKFSTGSQARQSGPRNTSWGLESPAIWSKMLQNLITLHSGRM